MQNRMNYKWLIGGMALLFAASLSIVSCKKKFDEPTFYVVPSITANTSIRDLKAKLIVSQAPIKITEDLIIEGVVNADDRSGNYYQQLSIQQKNADGTISGIILRLGSPSLFNYYPVGRKIYVKCNGLWLGDYGEMIQLGGGLDETGTGVTLISAPLLDTYIVKGELNQPLDTTFVTEISALVAKDINNPNSKVNTLIQLQGFEFANSDFNKTYADPTLPATPSARNFLIKNCNSSSAITLRTSNYSNFAGYKIPYGNGNMTGIFTIFRTTKQFTIRDTTDVQFTNLRCDGTSGPVPTVLKTIADIRNMYTGSDVKLGAYSVRGVVISDVINKNTPVNNLILQNGDKGLLFYYPGATLTNKIGDSVEINLTGATLTTYNGGLELKMGSGSTSPEVIASNVTVTPRQMTIAELNAAMSASPLSSSNESTLIKIVGATAPTGTYGGPKDLTDATGKITLYTGSGASFATSALPTGAKTWVAIATLFNSTNEIKIRNTGDVN